MTKKETIVNVILAGLVIGFMVGIMGYAVWISFESPKHNNELAEEFCSHEAGAATGIIKNGQYGRFAYACGLEIGESYVLYINTSNNRFSPMEFKADKFYHIKAIGFDKYTPETDWFVYLYSESEQSYIAQGVYYFEGGSMMRLLPDMFDALLPLMILLFLILGFGIPFETYILKRRILRRLFDFEPTKKEEKEEELEDVQET